MPIYLTGDHGWRGMSPSSIFNASILKLGPSCGPHYPITEPPHFQTFLVIKIEGWNLICIMFIQNGIQWYVYIWANPPPPLIASLLVDSYFTVIEFVWSSSVTFIDLEKRMIHYRIPHITGRVIRRLKSGYFWNYRLIFGWIYSYNATPADFQYHWGRF